MSDKYQKIIDKRIGRKQKREPKKDTERGKIQQLRAELRKALKENKELKKQIAQLEKAFLRTVNRLESVIEDQSVERVIRRIHGDEEEEETTVD